MKKAIFIFVTLLVAAGCSKEPVPGGRPDTGVPMTFGVASVESMQGTKAMIEDINDLEASCTPVTISPFVLNESIGVWADYEYLGTTFNNLLSNVELAFYDKTGGNTDGWNYNYGKDEEYWQMGGIYYFRAYYPQKAIKDAIISTSSAKTFIVNYNTEVMQEDMMVGYESVHTQTAPDLSQPVEMHLKHAMAALRFNFQFKYTEDDGKYYDEDYLTSVWLRNTDTDGFTTAGMMVYGVTDDDDNYFPEQIDWAESYQPDVRFYSWNYPDGVRFANEDVNGDKDGVDAYDPADEVKVATAYSMMPASESEKRYARNNGWIYIIPQRSDGTVELCFTTRKGGSDNVYSVKLPSVTGTGLDGIDPAGEYWRPSQRYTYTVSITKTDLEMYLHLSDWNQLDSSYSITF